MQLQFKLVEERFTPTLQFMSESKILLGFRYLNPRVPSVLKFHLQAFAPSWQSITLDVYQKIKDFINTKQKPTSLANVSYSHTEYRV